MVRLSRLSVFFVCALWAVQGGMARAQWGYPGGFGGFCWGGWGVAAITFSIHQLAKGPLPASLLTPEFDADREALKALDQRITEGIADGRDPDPATVERLLAVIYAAEEKSAKIFPRNSRARNEAHRYLKGLHGLVGMLKTPAIDVILAGVENRPDATLGELLNFMTAFNEPICQGSDRIRSRAGISARTCRRSSENRLGGT